MAVYLARTPQITHAHMAGLLADRRTRAARLAHWRERLDLPARVRLHYDDTGRLIGFRAPRPDLLPSGWTHSKGTLCPDRRTITGMSAAADLRAIPTGRTGARPGDRPWPGRMPDAVMLTGLDRATTPGRVSWSIERPVAGLLGARLFVRWPNGLPARERAHLDPDVWEEVPFPDWPDRTRHATLTPRNPDRW